MLQHRRTDKMSRSAATGNGGAPAERRGGPGGEEVGVRMTANRCIQITAVAIGAVWPVLAGPAVACDSERRWAGVRVGF
jgi:hypothetical protein